MTNISAKCAFCLAYYPVLLWLPCEVLPRDDGYVRLNATKYHDWQVLAHEYAMDGQIFRKEQQQYAEWLSQQPPAVEMRTYNRPAGILRRNHDVNINEINMSDGRDVLSIRGKEDEADSAKVSRVHRVNNGIPDDTTNSRRQSENAAPIDPLCDATCTENDGESTDLCNAAQFDESCVEDGNVVPDQFLRINLTNRKMRAIRR